MNKTSSVNVFERAYATHTDKRRTKGCREITRQLVKTLPGALFQTAMSILLYSYHMLSILTCRYIIFKLQLVCPSVSCGLQGIIPVSHAGCKVGRYHWCVSLFQCAPVFDAGCTVITPVSHVGCKVGRYHWVRHCFSVPVSDTGCKVSLGMSLF